MEVSAVRVTDERDIEKLISINGRAKATGVDTALVLLVPEAHAALLEVIKKGGVYEYPKELPDNWEVTDLGYTCNNCANGMTISLRSDVWNSVRSRRGGTRWRHKEGGMITACGIISHEGMHVVLGNNGVPGRRHHMTIYQVDRRIRC